MDLRHSLLSSIIANIYSDVTGFFADQNAVHLEENGAEMQVSLN